MRSGQQTYPPDEFDTVAPSGPRGAHRAPRSRWSRWWPFLVVLVLFPALAFGIVTWLSDRDSLPDALGPGVSNTDDPADDEQATEDPATEDPATEDPDAETTEEPEVEETPPPAPDLALPVEVFNSTGTSGLAGTAGETLEAAGHTEVTTGNWPGEDPDASVVWFPTPETETTAAAVAEALGISTVAASSDVTEITVVLASDFTP